MTLPETDDFKPGSDPQGVLARQVQGRGPSSMSRVHDTCHMAHGTCRHMHMSTCTCQHAVCCQPTHSLTPSRAHLARQLDWRFFQRDGKWYARETNTMPQWAGSCWYYLRFADPTNTECAWSPTAEKSWLPVDLYVGGAEHAVLHLLYARFWHKVRGRVGVGVALDLLHARFWRNALLQHAFTAPALYSPSP